MRGGDWRDVSLNVAREIRRREMRAGPADRSWEVVLPPGTDEVRRLTLTGSMPLGDLAAGWLAPDVTIVEATRAERIMVVATAELTVQGPAQGLEALPTARLPAWVGDHDRLRRPGTTAWSVTAPTAKLHLALARDRPTAPLARLYLADNRADFAVSRGWLFETTLWLWQDTAAELSVTWPADVKVLALEIDGSPQPPEQTEARRLWLPLATSQTLDSFLHADAAPGGRQVRLWWRWEDNATGSGTHSRTRPRLEGPQLAGVAPGPATWTVLVPPGCAISQQNGLAAGPGAAAAVALARAEAQLRGLVLASKVPRRPAYRRTGRGRLTPTLSRPRRWPDWRQSFGERNRLSLWPEICPPKRDQKVRRWPNGWPGCTNACAP